MAERHDKELYKSVTVRFSYVDEDHGNLLAKLSKESKERHISKNKLILECIKEHYESFENEQFKQVEKMIEELRHSMEIELKKAKDDMRKEFYLNVIQALASRSVMNSQQAMNRVSASKEKVHEDTGEFDPSTDENMMANIMKWS